MQTRAQPHKREKPLPSAGPLKRDPKGLEKMLDQALKDSMPASDPASTVMPEVKKDPEQNKS